MVFFVMYSLSGEMFEIPPYKVKSLIDLGWTFWPAGEEPDVFGDVNKPTSDKKSPVEKVNAGD